ncbi:TonB-dependent receptor [Vulcaniibacterium tengchongense]|uniref:TonB-dependent receptor n=1 Tax=Vulcaniibacterium tengchongense TaxID=1273429 RepID=A0A3N4VSL2_9GAMM|nr:TonB-dependent receptor [Vulcaniibacterium tengchongense]RPE80067.1 TonB-dependent receptor [Vulcaniibacterium tengchongense]
MNVRKTLLSASILAALAGVAGTATAQQAAAPQATAAQPAAADQDPTDLDTIVVTGIRASLMKSLETKRNADAVVEALTAEDIGDFPNTNVAEAMAQIPGVTLDRRFGQGERVSIDGTDPSLNLTFLDGHPVAQTIWLYGENPSRGFDHTLIASEIIGRLEVYKSPEARLPEGSLGGTVLMHSRQPLDLEANTINGSVGYNYNDQASEGQPNASLLYSWKNADETFGLTIAAQHHEEQVDRQGIEVFGYVKASDLPNQVGAPADADVPNFINAAWFQQERKRDSVMLNLQSKPTDELEFQLSGLYIKESFDNYNQSMYNFLTNTPGTTDRLDVGAGGVVTSGHAGAGSNTFYDNNVRSSEVTTKGLDARASFDAGDWELSGQIGASKSKNPRMQQWFIEPVYQGGYSWDIDRGITFDDPAAARDPANWRGTDWMGNTGVFQVEAKDTYGQLDWTRNLGGGFFNQLLVGVRYNEHEENFQLNVYGGVRAGASLADVGTIGYVDILDGFGGFSPDHGRHIYVGRGNVRNWVEGSPIDFASGGDPGSHLNNTWALRQDNTAGYVQLNFANDLVRGNFGLRYVTTDIDATGYNYGGAPVLPPPAGSWQTRSSDHDFLLPSFNVVFDTGADVLFRLSGAKVIAWAPYNQMVNNTFLNDSTLTGAGGNAELEPYESYNYNASVEWYFADEAVLAATLFYKDVSNYIDQEATTERWYNSIRDNDPANWQANYANNPTTGCTADGFCDYSIQRPFNAGGAEVKGITLSYQQPFADTGFGLSANYTYADGETDAGTGMPYLSENTVNISPYYEKGPFTARVTYNWRDEYLAGGYVAGAPPAAVDDYTDVGLSLGWRFNDHYSISFDAMNLTDEEYGQYQVDASGKLDKTHPLNRYTTGRRYMASFQFKF